MQHYPFLSHQYRLSGPRYKAVTILLSLALLCAALTVTGCFKKEEKAVKEKVVNVRIMVVEKRSLKPFVESVGTLKSDEEVMISSEIDGILKVLKVQEGSIVSNGILLAQINDTDYRLELNRAEAALRQMDASLANAKVEFERKEALYKDALVTRQQYDDIVARRLLAEGEVDRARGTLDLAKEKLAKTRINAPMAGVIKEKKVTPGDYIRNGTPLLVLVRNNPIKLSFTVTEKDVARLKTGQECVFKVDSFPGREFQGKLSVIYPNLEERTRSLQAEALVPNPQMILKPGLFARVTLYTGAAGDKVLVPITALLYENNKVKVFVVDGGQAKEQFVQVGSKYGEFMEIVEGLKGGEQLVVVGQNNLAEGVKVNVAR
ncbi:MAG: efflux RND transporter periplasmic adaptor subunit [Deltaproteobacteria bacterium]|nr:efflux RND transporter periplasmic adaptor subunit [Deltaproteobacteria bacterium]